jgi:hypothetical protein
LKPTIVRRPGEGDPPMTPEQTCDLALTFYTIIFESHDVAEPNGSTTAASAPASSEVSRGPWLR